MDHDTAIRTLAASVAALTRVVQSELVRFGIETSTHEMLEAIEGEARALYRAFGGTAYPDLPQGGE